MRQKSSQKSNKSSGTKFEHEFAVLLAQHGFWAHVLEPKRNGSQPFDIMAVKNGIAYAFDCKVCENDFFTINRIAENQHLAFEKWSKCGNGRAFIALKFAGEIFIALYSDIITGKKKKGCEDVLNCGGMGVDEWISSLADK